MIVQLDERESDIFRRLQEGESYSFKGFGVRLEKGHYYITLGTCYDVKLAKSPRLTKDNISITIK
jgi:hypothetical protein